MMRITGSSIATRNKLHDRRDVAGLLRHAIARADHLRHVLNRATQEDACVLVAETERRP